MSVIVVPELELAIHNGDISEWKDGVSEKIVKSEEQYLVPLLDPTPINNVMTKYPGNNYDYWFSTLWRLYCLHQVGLQSRVFIPNKYYFLRKAVYPLKQSKALWEVPLSWFVKIGDRRTAKTTVMLGLTRHLMETSYTTHDCYLVDDSPIAEYWYQGCISLETPFLAKHVWHFGDY